MKDRQSLALAYEDLEELQEIGAEQMNEVVGGAANNPVLSTMEHQLQSDYKKYNIGNTDYTKGQLDHQLLTAVSNFQECGVSAAGNESEIVKYVEGTDGITLDKQIGELEHNVQSETNSLVTGGFVSNSQVYQAICEVQTLAEHTSPHGGYLSQQSEQSILQTVNNDTGITKSIQTAEIAVNVAENEEWAHSYMQGNSESFSQIAADVIKQVSEVPANGLLSQQQVDGVVSCVERHDGIATAIQEKDVVEHVMSDYVKYDAFNQVSGDLQKADFQGLLQKDVALLGNSREDLTEVMQVMEVQSGALQGKVEYDQIKQAIENQTVTSAEHAALVDHPNLVRNELSAYALALESQEPGLTTASLENQVRRAYENNNGITYEMAYAEIRSDLAPINLGNGEFLNLTAAQNQAVDTELEKQVEGVMSANNLSVGSGRAGQIQAIVDEVEYDDGITAALGRNTAFNDLSSANPFEALHGVGYFNKSLEICADVTIGAVEIATAAAGAGAIVAGAAAGAAAGAEVAADTAEAVEVASTGARVVDAVETAVAAGGTVSQTAEETPNVAAMTARVEAMTSDATTLQDNDSMAGELCQNDVDYFPSLVDRPVPANALSSTSVIPKAGIEVGGVVKALLESGAALGGVAGLYELEKHFGEGDP
ncbi:MAG: hypothetical protein K2W95_16665 [Candidatus Obscuribacterales bacterium]|nr:hypothetical protein [Candidatus Obscuribacterales bacterium]